MLHYTPRVRASAVLKLAAFGAALAGAACSDPTARADLSSTMLAALSSAPVGYGSLTSSYVGSTADEVRGGG